jgi:hypothetical protein
VAEDGRPSESGHPGTGCFIGLVLLPLVLLRWAAGVIGEIGGLYPTRTRLSLLKAVREGQGRIYFEASEVWDNTAGTKVTARMRELIRAGWVRALKPDEPRGPGEIGPRTYYRIERLGYEALKGQAK